MAYRGRDDFRIIHENGKAIYVTDGWAVDGSGKKIPVTFGTLKEDLAKIILRGTYSEYGQFCGLVLPGMVSAAHLFKGLNRKLYADDSPDGDKEILVYSRKPSFDYEWRGGRHGRYHTLDAPKDSVFVVIISPNTRHRHLYPSIYGWFDRWNWVPEDQYLKEAPINWLSRYDNKLFSN